MMISTAILAAIAVAALGAVILWANPRRRVNQTVFSCAFHGVAWLVLLHTAFVADEGLWWLRATTALGAFFPFHLWLVKESIISADSRFMYGCRRRAVAWLSASALLAAVCFTDFFIPSTSTDENRIYGLGYYLHITGLLLLYLILWRQMFLQAKAMIGVRRLELQIWFGGGIGACGGVVLLMAITALTGDSRLTALGPVVVICFFAVTTTAITISRVFDAKHLLFISVQRALLVLTVAGTAFLAHELLVLILPAPLALIATTAIALYLANAFSVVIDRLLQQYPRASEARSKALSVAMREMRPEPLTESFNAIIRGWSQSERAAILSNAEGPFTDGGFEGTIDPQIVATLQEVRWATPERLSRERETSDRRFLADFLGQERWGLIVLCSGPAFSLIIVVGVRATRRPFTYPEVQQLQELGSIFQTALARSHLWTKAQRAEQLATVGLLGASVAHEIRNPMVTIKSFVHLLPQHYDDPRFRERFFRLISEEVARIDRLTEQLLDLASPRHYNPEKSDLHQIILSSLDLVATKAEERQVTIHRELEAVPDTVFTDPNAARQVLLNLCFNGIQAQEQQSGRERWLRLSTRNVPQGVELCVADHGPGIGQEARSHLFQAFHSTKSSGFGLGLAICSEILSSLNATITLDPYVAGEGAAFRVVFPCQPPTS